MERILPSPRERDREGQRGRQREVAQAQKEGEAGIPGRQAGRQAEAVRENRQRAGGVVCSR